MIQVDLIMHLVHKMGATFSSYHKYYILACNLSLMHVVIT